MHEPSECKKKHCEICSTFYQLEMIAWEMAKLGFQVMVVDPVQEEKAIRKARSKQFDEKFMQRARITWGNE